jgi:CP family cyanate transporter-like MFS transporter
VKRALLVAGIILAALNLRPAIAGVSPLLGEIMADLDLTPAAGGLITTIMVVCLGVVAPAAPVLVRRWGLDRTVLAGLIVLTAGALLRSVDGLTALYAGAAVVGAAIAVLNVLMPALVKHHFPGHTGPLTGVYVTALVLGATAGAGLSIPVEQAIGQGWRPAAAATALLSAVAAVLWLPQALDRTRPPAPQRRLVTLLRDRVTWYVTGFMGLQSLTFYVVLAWLPTVFTDAGLEAERAGYLLALSSLVQIATTLSVPVLASRAATQSGFVVAAAVLTIVGYLGVLLFPATASWVWAVLLGLGQGASIALALLLIALRSPDPVTATALSAVAQSFGYVLAASGPVLVGLLLQASGGWTAPLTLVIGVLVAQLAVGALAGRSRLVLAVR